MSEWLEHHKADVFNTLIINDPAVNTKRPDVRRNNTNIVVIKRPVIEGIKRGVVAWSTEELEGSICDLSASDIVEQVTSDEGVMDDELMRFCYQQARYIGYVNPHVAIQGAMHAMAVNAGMMLTSKASTPSKNFFRVMDEDEVKEIMKKVIKRTPKAADVAFESGLRSSRLVTSEYLPYQAKILRQVYHNIITE